MSNILSHLLHQYKSLPNQRSREWLEGRKKTIGGSEIHYIKNVSNIQQFLNNKFDKKKFIIPCQFGILFEEEILKISQWYLDCIIHSDIGSIKNPNLKYISFSPDGIGIVKDETVLFEFKCPYSRIPNGTIKNEYYNQMQLGLNLLPFCKKCLYIEAVFKKCPIEQLEDPYIYYDFCSDIEKKYSTEQVKSGIILLCDSNDKNISGNSNPLSAFTDYGKSNKIESEMLLYHIFNQQIIPYHHNETTSISRKIIGILPWKCFNYNIIEVPRDFNYFNKELRKKCLYYGHLLHSYPHLNQNSIQEYIAKGKKLFKSID